jgi:hypothetical protein
VFTRNDIEDELVSLDPLLHNVGGWDVPSGTYGFDRQASISCKWQVGGGRRNGGVRIDAVLKCATTLVLLVDRRAHYSSLGILYATIREKGHLYPQANRNPTRRVRLALPDVGGAGSERGWDNPSSIYGSWAPVGADRSRGEDFRMGQAQYTIQNHRLQFIEGAQVRLLTSHFHAMLTDGPKAERW